jgi:hypothetical protein
MAQKVEIRDNRDAVIATFSFDESPAHLYVQRTLAGFRFHFPVKFTLRFVRRDEPIPVIANLHGDLFAVFGDSPVEIGSVTASDELEGHWSEDGSGSVDRDIYLRWAGSLSELAALEKLRAGRAPRFSVGLRGDTMHAYIFNRGGPRFRSAPERLRLPSGAVSFAYPAETWVKALRSVGAAENVVVEIPLPPAPPAPWDEVWQFLVKARDSFERGGSTGWEGCVVGVRQALEKWRDIEAPQIGPTDPTQRTKAERIDNLRAALHSCTHVWIHGQAADCTRDDAVLMLTTLSALLAERNP